MRRERAFNIQEGNKFAFYRKRNGVAGSHAGMKRILDEFFRRFLGAFDNGSRPVFRPVVIIQKGISHPQENQEKRCGNNAWYE
jgi:hypothetical protein